MGKAVICIAVIACSLLAYFAGRMDAKRKVQREVNELKRTLALAEEAQKSTATCLWNVKKELLQIRKSIVEVQKPTSSETIQTHIAQ